MRPWRRRKETLDVFSLCAKIYKSVYISVNNNTNLNLFKILSNYIYGTDYAKKPSHATVPLKKGSAYLMFSFPIYVTSMRTAQGEVFCINLEWCLVVFFKLCYKSSPKCLT
jgi:hypothetical protein